MTDNRRYSNGTFFCQSRGECSINVAGDSNRDDFIDYLWIFPDGTISDEKNPKAFDLGYGQYTLILLATDGITGEVTLDTASVIHTTLPKKSSSASKNYTLDLKDIPQDTGGGVLVSGKGGANVLLRQ